MTDYKTKYFKYKEKYIALKKLQAGGSVDDSEVIDEMHFWGHQMIEHALFLHLGLEDMGLKARALELHKKWQMAMDEAFASKGIEEEKIVLDSSDLAKLAGTDFSPIIRLLSELKDFKQQVVDRLSKGEWIGWVYQSLAEHTMKELVHMEKKVNKQSYPVLDQIDFYNTINAEHTGVTSHWFDPDPQNDEDMARALELFHKGVKMVENHKQAEQQLYLKLSLDYADELGQFEKKTKNRVNSHTVKSIIHPTMIAHDVREGDRSVYCLKRLQGK
jgi:hypothetical protein